MWHTDENGNAYRDTGEKMYIKPIYRVIHEDKYGNNRGTVTYSSKKDAIEHIRFMTENWSDSNDD